MRTYSQALKYLDSFTDHEKIGFRGLVEKLDLERVRLAAAALGDPQRDYRSVHVAGTKGKGSICAFTASILESAGSRVGSYTSPHLSDASERIRINSKPVPKSDLVKVVARLERELGPDARKRFTFFEVYTLAAMLYFSLEKVDWAVFEAGLGGRLDATNILQPEVCCVSPVSHDHTRVLGSTIREIAGEKAGIIKKGMKCVCAPQKPAAMRVIKERCARLKVPLYVVGRDITFQARRMDETGSVFDVRGKSGLYEEVETTLPGLFQVENAAAAVGICEFALGKKGALKERTVREGLKKAFLPGRMEVICREPLLVIDGAQNAESAGALKRSVEKIFKYDKLILLAGLSSDKDIKGFCGRLGPLADRIVITRAGTERAADPHIIKGYFRGRRARVTRDTKEGLGAALSMAGKKDMILAAGSFYVIGEIRNIFTEKSV